MILPVIRIEPYLSATKGGWGVRKPQFDETFAMSSTRLLAQVVGSGKWLKNDSATASLHRILTEEGNIGGSPGIISTPLNESEIQIATG